MNNRQIGLSIFFFILFATLVCRIADAEEAQSVLTPPAEQEVSAESGRASPEALRRRQQLSPEQKQKLRGRWEQWKKLDPAQKAQIKQRFQQYQKLSPEMKKNVRRNWEKIRNLPPEKRRELAAKYKQWKQLPPPGIEGDKSQEE